MKHVSKSNFEKFSTNRYPRKHKRFKEKQEVVTSSQLTHKPDNQIIYRNMTMDIVHYIALASRSYSGHDFKTKLC